jgi:hypothetical protein
MLKTVIDDHPLAQTRQDMPIPQGDRSREKTAGVASGYVEDFPEARTKVGKERVSALGVGRVE